MKKLAFTLLAFLGTLFLYGQNTYYFTRNDSIVVKFNSDTLKFAWAGGINYGQFSNIDLNFDGIQDLLVFDRTGNKVLTFIHTGASGSVDYIYDHRYEGDFPAMMNWCLLYDFNCDDLPDIFTHTPGGIMVYRNVSTTSGISFIPETSLIKSNQLGNFVNLYVSSVDIPGLSDIDEDGDLDILTFGVFGNTVEYHRNYSVENGYGCDSLQFVMMNQCWGCFSEDLSTNNVNLFDTCSNSGISNPQLAEIIEEATANELAGIREERHTGSCFCVLDVDGNKMKDLLLGDVSFSNSVLVVNGSTSFNSNMCMDSSDINFPSYDDPISLKLFPCSFYVDVNNDGKRDLVTTPQSTGLSENARGVVYHYNSNQDSLPYFNFVNRDLLQNEMVETGEGSYPVPADYNGDGLLDLFVANYGYFNSANDTYVSKLSLYENVGSAANPVFNLVSSNFESLDLVIGLDNLYPAFGDLDNDGDIDMILGNETGTMSYFENIAGAGNPSDFSLVQAGLTDATATLIDVGVSASPVMADLDRDGDLDLVVGNKSGKLSYYQNIGTSASFTFRYETDFLGMLNVKEWWDNSGYSVPSFYDDNGSYQLFIGSKNGHIHRYDSIDGNLNGSFRLIDSTFFEETVGIRSTVSVVNINGDTLPDMFMGNYRGGITFYKGSAQPDPDGLKEMVTNNFLVFPNPAKGEIYIQAPEVYRDSEWEIFDLTGRKVDAGKLNSARTLISLNALSAGTYLIRIQKDSTFEIHKIILCHE